MNHTKGELHRHGRDIHIERSEKGQVVEHTCIAVANDTTHLAILPNMNHLILCWNSHDALTKQRDALLMALKNTVPQGNCGCRICKQTKAAIKLCES